jgi:hypothetical protein
MTTSSAIVSGIVNMPRLVDWRTVRPESRSWKAVMPPYAAVPSAAKMSGQRRLRSSRTEGKGGTHRPELADVKDVILGREEERDDLGSELHKVLPAGRQHSASPSFNLANHADLDAVRGALDVCDLLRPLEAAVHARPLLARRQSLRLLLGGLGRLPLGLDPAGIIVVGDEKYAAVALLEVAAQSRHTRRVSPTRCSHPGRRAGPTHADRISLLA